MQYKQVTIQTAPVGLEYLSNLLVVLGAEGFEICDSSEFKAFLSSKSPRWDYIDSKLQEIAEKTNTITFYTPKTRRGDALIQKVRDAVAKLKAEDGLQLGSLDMTVRFVNDEDWKDSWKKYYKPIQIGDLLVLPAWERQTVSDIPVLKIDPGMAFGTGTHETTALCLELICALCPVGKRVLDIGSGSGILSQAAVLLGAESAVGCDIDSAAVKVAIQNAKRNGISDKTQYHCGDLLEKIDGKFDLVVANIVADVIIRLAPDLCNVIEKDGVFIASGIIDKRVCEVNKALRDAGFVILSENEQNGWYALEAKLSE